MIATFNEEMTKAIFSLGEQLIALLSLALLVGLIAVMTLPVTGSGDAAKTALGVIKLPDSATVVLDLISNLPLYIR